MSVPFSTEQNPDTRGFRAYMASRLDELGKFGDTPVPLTGNPYTDNAIMTVTTLHRMYFGSEVDPVDLRFKHILDVFAHGAKGYEYGRELAWINKAANATLWIFPNNPLFHQSYTDSDSSNPVYLPQGDSGPSILAEQIYLYYLLEFLSDLTSETPGRFCSFCGSNRVFNFDRREKYVKANALHKEGKKFTLGLSRSWYPLVGTIKEAQAYHGYSEQPKICGTCLFLVHYLPMGTRLFKGKLVLFQTNDVDITLALTQMNVSEFYDRYSIGMSGLKSPGTGEGSSSFYIHLLEIFREIATLKGVDEMEFRSNLTLWIFSNENKKPYSEIEEIPSRVLLNLHLIDLHWEKELRRFLVTDKKTRGSFIDSITLGKEYLSFYPKISNDLPSLDFFEFYQTRIIGRPPAVLNFIRMVSDIVREKNSRKAIDAGLKEGSSTTIRQMVHTAVIEGVSSGDLDVSNALYWIMVETGRSGYRPFQYYLHPKAEYSTAPVESIEVPADLNVFMAPCSSYLSRAYARGGFNPHSFTSALNQESVNRFNTELIRLGNLTPGLGWKRLADLQSEVQVLLPNRYLIHMVFRLICIDLMQREQFEERALAVEPYSSVEELEEDSLLTESLLQSIYQYLKIRAVDEEFGLPRAVNDLIRLISESGRSLPSLIYYLEQKGVQVDEYDFLSSQELYESYKGEDNPSFSWYSMKQQLLNYLNQLVLIEGWQVQVENEIEAIE